MNCCKYITLSLLCAFVLFSSFRNEYERYGETIITQRGDEITFSKPKEREVVVGKSKIKRSVTTEPPVPILLNGKRIYNLMDYPDKDRTKDSTLFNIGSREYTIFREMIELAIAGEMSNLLKGDYICMVTNLVVNDKGYIAYYETEGLQKHLFSGNPFNKPRTQPINPTSAYIINHIIDKQAGKMRFTPLLIDGKATPYLTSFTFHFYR